MTDDMTHGSAAEGGSAGGAEPVDTTGMPGTTGSTGTTGTPGTTGGPYSTSKDAGDSWPEPEAGRTRDSRDWMAQLQTMIDQVATQAAPVVREVGAKAAELAAIAGEKAGPVAHRAATLTQEAGLKLAERSRDLAAELRRDQTGGNHDETTDGAPGDGPGDGGTAG